MNIRESHRYEAFSRIYSFITSQPESFPIGSRAAMHAAKLHQITKELDAAKASQAPGTATAKTLLIDALPLDLQNITRTARAIDQDEPGFADGFHTPERSTQLALMRKPCGLRR